MPKISSNTTFYKAYLIPGIWSKFAQNIGDILNKEHVFENGIYRYPRYINQDTYAPRYVCIIDICS